MKLFSKRNPIFKWVAMSILIVAGFALATFIAIRIFFPAEKIKGTLEAELSDRLDKNVTIKSISVGLYPGIELAMSGVKVTDPQTLQEIVSARNVGLVLNLLQLLERKIVVEKIIVGSPSLDLVREADGTWNLGKFIEGISGKKPSPEKESTRGELIKSFEIEPIKVRNGTIRVRDVSGQPLVVSKIAALIDLRKEDVRIDSASISYPPVEAEVAGTVSKIAASTPVLDIDATLRVSKEGPLASFRAADVPEGARLASCSVTVSGPIDGVDLKTAFSLNRSVMKGFPTEGTLTGKLKAKEGFFEVAAFNSRFGGSSVTLSGSCSNLWSDNRTADLKGTSKIELKKVLNLAGGKLVSEIQPQGFTNATITLKASMQEIGLKANLDLTNAGLVIPDLTRKEPGTPGSLLLDARFVIPKEIIVDNFELDIGQAKVSGRASANPDLEPWAKIALKTSDFPLESLNEVPSICFEKGTASVTAEVWQSKPGAERVNYRGDATIHDAVLMAEYLKEPVSDLNAVVDWSDEKATVESVSFSFAKSSYCAQGEIRDFTRPQIVGVMHVDGINIDEIAAAIGSEQSIKSSAQGDFSLKMLISTDSVRVGDLETGPLSGGLQIADNVYTFGPFKMNVFDGELHGTSEFIPSENGIRWKTEFDGRRLKLAELLAQLQTGETTMTGLMDAKGGLEGVVAPNTKDVLQSLSGEVKLTAKDGVVNRSTLLKTVFMFMQVPIGPMLVPGVREVTIFNTLLDAVKTGGRSLDLTSIAYTKIRGNFRLTDGVAHTDDLRFESGMADLLCEGDVNLGDNTMDVKIRATPLGAISSLIGKVPLAGKPVKKAKEVIVSTDFVARGPIGNPTVTPATVDKLLPKDDKS